MKGPTITWSVFRRVLSGIILFGAAACGAFADVVTEVDPAIMQSTVAVNNVFIQTQNAAITPLAVFEAVNAVVGDYEPHLGTNVAPSDVSPEAAAITAAYHALSMLYPNPRTLAILDDHALLLCSIYPRVLRNKRYRGRDRRGQCHRPAA